MTNPEVSIVIPTYNHARMQRAVDIVLRTYENFEVVIADDASADETETTARSFTDLRIRYFRQPLNVGIGRNWGFGLSQARGRFVSLLMDDDGYFPTFLVDRMAASPPSPTLGWYTSSYHVLQPDGTRTIARLPVEAPSLACGAELLRHLLFRPPLDRVHSVPPGGPDVSLVCRRAV